MTPHHGDVGFQVLLDRWLSRAGRWYAGWDIPSDSAAPPVTVWPSVAMTSPNWPVGSVVSSRWGGNPHIGATRQATHVETSSQPTSTIFA